MYLPEQKLQEIYFLPGSSALGERYCFSIVHEALAGAGS